LPQKNTKIAKNRLKICGDFLCFFAFFGGKDTFLNAANFMLPWCLFAAQPRGWLSSKFETFANRTCGLSSSRYGRRECPYGHTTNGFLPFLGRL